ncbi:copper chaperone PCu(A)C [Roseovarius sp. SK2]|uniref:copper chaperone PCu(A)C n=1 Tax=Roseovarius TaxID=74030 RepID=UPI00237AEBCC|nr:copper chaperone PCu(A)C [Roseovarius sp. SK2]MDD9726887.1 copper chaperone PCu(A)C [Roseovarius sp. SK2]
MKTLPTLASALILSTGIATAHDYTVGDLEIMHPMAFETPKMAKAGAGFLTITNNGDTDDVLLEVRADFPKVEVHTTEETDGVAKMMHVENLPIPAGEAVELSPGAYHVMFMGLEAPFEDGQEIPATLVFEKAGEVEITFNVEARPEGGDSMDHSNH